MTPRRLPRLGRRAMAALIAAVVVVVAVVIPVALNGSASIRHTAQFVPGTPEGPAPVRLDTTIYYPSHTPAPAVPLAHGFGGSKADLVGPATTVAPHGYGG